MQKINVTELKPGMVVVDPKLSWVISPYLYTTAGPVRSDEEVAAIVKEGFLEVYIQDERFGFSQGQFRAFFVNAQSFTHEAHGFIV